MILQLLWKVQPRVVGTARLIHYSCSALPSRVCRDAGFWYSPMHTSLRTIIKYQKGKNVAYRIHHAGHAVRAWQPWLGREYTLCCLTGMSTCRWFQTVSLYQQLYLAKLSSINTFVPNPLFLDILIFLCSCLIHCLATSPTPSRDGPLLWQVAIL